LTPDPFSFAADVIIRHVRREQNKRADQLCNEALDGDKKRPAAARPPKAKAPAVHPARKEQVREEALVCLRAAAREWARGNADMPPPEQVWEQLWTILEEGGVLRAARPR
jgi:hypothetical protein